MTIVVQHWFADLDVAADGFSIVLNFGDNPEPLYIPFDAIKTFVDPSVEFGLRFEPQEAAAEPEPEPTPPPATRKGGPGTGPGTGGDAQVVSLDKFRK